MAITPPDVHTLFNQALEQESAEQREQFLELACSGDTQLRQRVDMLLQAYLAAGDFLGGTAPDLAPTEHAPESQSSKSYDSALQLKPGTRIGHYKLREKIAEGGMGVVYVAEQTEPVRRKVALKVIKPGMSTRDVIARFEAERQALALMDHPHIARVIDGGSTESGQPYFVMELVQGLTLTNYCDSHRLGTEQRLQLFMKVCRAVQHAHQKGIIHRDLKPSNVLVSEIDDEAVPKVIDFGVAKALHQKLSEQTVYTQFSQMVGTPLYMSPEQVGLGVVDVDTRSDVYSLGAVLYELLTGHTPFDSKTLKEAGYDEMRRIIREQDPPGPSTMLSTLNAEALSTVAEHRGQEPRKLRQFFAGELDLIVMKALEKDRNRRYESASALVADFERYLSGEPVQACPPSAWYRLSKLAKRHQAALLTISMVALGLVVGIGAATWQAIRATRAEARETARLQLARTAVDEMYTKVAEEWLANQGSLTELQRDFLEKALVFYQQFADENSEDPHDIWQALMALERVGKIQTRLAKKSDSDSTYQRLEEEAKAAARRFPNKPEFHIVTAVALIAENKVKEAAQSFELGKAAAFANSNDLFWFGTKMMELSNVFASQGMERNFEVVNRLAHGAFERLLAEDPSSWDSRLKMCKTELTVGLWQLDRNRIAEGMNILDKTNRVLNQLLLERPDSYEGRLLHSRLMNNLGVRESRQQRWSRAVEYIRNSVATLESLLVDFPRDRIVLAALGNEIEDYLVLAKHIENFEKHIELRRRRFELLRELVKVDGRVSTWQAYFYAAGDLGKSATASRLTVSQWGISKVLQE
ncbi:MAG: serine/threonine protein kinase [Planctomycetales bacterium]|nr:serine/threonine protein kinase [Planctomycetales bacterium]